MGGGKEGFEQTQESCAVLHVQDGSVEHVVQSSVELRIVEVVTCDQGEDGVEREKGGGSARVEAGDEEVMQEVGLVRLGRIWAWRRTSTSCVAPG